MYNALNKKRQIFAKIIYMVLYNPLVRFMNTNKYIISVQIKNVFHNKIRGHNFD